MIAPPVSYAVADDIERPYEDRIGPKLDVFLNGSPVSKVIRFNTAIGELERYRTQPDGHILYDPVRGEVEREVLTGKVEVRWREVANA